MDRIDTQVGLLELLLAFAKSNCTNARNQFLQALIDAFDSDLLIYCTYLLKDKEKIRDLRQETYLSVAEKVTLISRKVLLQNKEDQLSYLFRYIKRIAYNKCMDEYKRTKRFTKVEQVEHFYANEETMNISNQLEEAIQALPEEYEQVIRLKFYNNMSCIAIANKCQNTVFITRRRIYTGLEMIKDVLNGPP